jgi:hypothetical protein
MRRSGLLQGMHYFQQPVEGKEVFLKKDPVGVQE